MFFSLPHLTFSDSQWQIPSNQTLITWTSYFSSSPARVMVGDLLSGYISKCHYIDFNTGIKTTPAIMLKLLLLSWTRDTRKNDFGSNADPSKNSSVYSFWWEKLSPSQRKGRVTKKDNQINLGAVSSDVTQRKWAQKPGLLANTHTLFGKSWHDFTCAISENTTNKNKF